MKKEENREAQYRDLKKRLLEVGSICEGSLTRVFQECGQPSCRCHQARRYRHGPYYFWTRKVKGKTVTRGLSKTDAATCREWIANNRRLNAILRRLRALCLKAAPWKS